jgi:peptide/nickel transport system substrate-binding protein
MKKIKKLAAAVIAVTLALGSSLNAFGATDVSKKKDTIYFGQEGDPRGLDCALIDDGASNSITSCIYEGLTQYEGDTLNVVPCLAESWDLSADKLTYTFHLRTDVKFHDGTKFDAEAAKYNFDRVTVNSTPDMPYASFQFGHVAKVEVVDEYTLEITLDQPYTPFLANCAMIGLASGMASPKAIQKTVNDRFPAGNINNAPCGTGPYKFKKWQKGVSVTLVRNDSYWGTKAPAKQLIFAVKPDSASRMLSLIQKEIDVVAVVDTEFIDTLKSTEGVTVPIAPSNNLNYMAFNCTREPFNDPKLREAICHAINVPEMVEALYLGEAEVANCVLPPVTPGYDASVKPYAYDVEKAKSMLKELGKEGMTINMISYSSTRGYNPAGGAKLAQAGQSYLEKVGLKVNITMYDWTDYKAKVGQGEGDICFYGWGSDNGDPDNFMTLLSDTDRSMNVSGYDSKEYIDLINKAAAEPNGDSRWKLYNQAEALVAKDAPWLPLNRLPSMAAYGPGITHFNFTGMGGVQNWTTSKR